MFNNRSIETDGSKPKDLWDKLLMLSGFIASVLVPIVVVVVANTYTNAMKESEIRFRYSTKSTGVELFLASQTKGKTIPRRP